MTIDPDRPAAQPCAPEPPTATSTAQDGGFEALHPNARWGFRVGQMLPTLGACLALLAVARGIWLGKLLGGAGMLALTALVLVLAVIWAWRMAERRFRAVRFRLDGEGLSIHRGVWWRSETHVPRSRVQHTDIQSGPLDRRLGLADLLVHTAGTQMATVRLEGLAVERARALRDALLEGHDQQF